MLKIGLGFVSLGPKGERGVEEVKERRGLWDCPDLKSYDIFLFVANLLQAKDFQVLALFVLHEQWWVIERQ